jgi:hypothetical protein
VAEILTLAVTGFFGLRDTHAAPDTFPRFLHKPVRPRGPMARDLMRLRDCRDGEREGRHHGVGLRMLPRHLRVVASSSRVTAELLFSVLAAPHHDLAARALAERGH